MDVALGLWRLLASGSQANYVGSVVYLYGLYADRLEEGEEGWRIVRRELVFLGPGFVGNLSLVGMWLIGVWLGIRPTRHWHVQCKISLAFVDVTQPKHDLAQARRRRRGREKPCGYAVILVLGLVNGHLTGCCDTILLLTVIYGTRFNPMNCYRYRIPES